jgi:hypothetical protein
MLFLENNKIIKNSVLGLLFMMLLFSCKEKNATNSESVTTKTTPKENYFKGIIRFKETYNNVSEKLSKSLITITVDGENVKREVKIYKLGMLENTVGMMYFKNKDSVYYYNTTPLKSIGVALPKSDYLAWVKTRTLPTDSLKNGSQYHWQIPFGDIFAPLEDQVNLNIKIAENISIMNLKNCNLMTILFDETKTCTVGYSNEINLAPTILGFIEYNQPKSLKTIALSVHYSSLKKATSKLDKILEKTNQLGKPSIQYNGHENLDKPDISLPKNTVFYKPEIFNNIVSPPEEPSSGSGHHHHDFF